MPIRPCGYVANITICPINAIEQNRIASHRAQFFVFKSPKPITQQITANSAEPKGNGLWPKAKPSKAEKRKKAVMDITPMRGIVLPGDPLANS